MRSAEKGGAVATTTSCGTSDRRLAAGAQRRGRPEDLRIGLERQVDGRPRGAPQPGPHGTTRAVGLLQHGGLGLVRRLERPRPDDACRGRHVAREAGVGERHRSVLRREDGGLPPVPGQVLEPLRQPLDAGSAHGRKCVGHEERTRHRRVRLAPNGLPTPQRLDHVPHLPGGHVPQLDRAGGAARGELRNIRSSPPPRRQAAFFSCAPWAKSLMKAWSSIRGARESHAPTR